MASGTWRGIVGVIKPTYSSGSLVEFIRLLPEGVGCIPMYAGMSDDDVAYVADTVRDVVSSSAVRR